LTATPAAANPALLIVAPAAMGSISAGWAAAAGLGGVLFGTALGAAAANNGWNGYGGYYHPGYAYRSYGYGGYTAYAPYGYGGYAAPAPYGYRDAAYDGPVYGAPAYGAPVYGQAYAAPAPVSHCYRSHRWVNGYSVPVRVCVTPY
jgi:hypothetical protein